MASRESGSLKKRMTVTAVIPVHNSAAYIEETLLSIINQRRRFDEILVVDDGSTDDTVAAVRKYPVKILEVRRCGRSAARNIGWREARGEIIAFIESDAVYEQDWLVEVEKALEEGHRAVLDQRRMYRPATFYARLSDHLYELKPDDFEPLNAWIIEKTLLEKLGGFDESLHIAEDIELGDRIKAAGIKIYWARKAVHSHKGEASTFPAALKRSYVFGRGMFDYWWKDPGKRSLPWLARTLALSWGLFFPPAFVYAFVKTCCKRFLRGLRRGMKPRYLPVEPLLYVANQLFLQVGASVTLLRYLLIENKLRLAWRGSLPAIEERTEKGMARREDR